MADLQGFRAIHYDPAQCGPMDNVITPPFDVISPEERAELGAKSPYNYSHIILPESPDGGDKYGHAASLLEKWLSEGVLTQDNEPTYCLLTQEFTGLDGRDYMRRGFFAACKVPEPDEEGVLGHEQTFEYKIKDRFSLTKATRANTGAVFLVYDDPEGTLKPFLSQTESREPDFTARTIDGVVQKVWFVPADPAVADFFKGKTLYIADGHHRFATARAYRDAKRAEEKPDGLRPYDYALVGMVALDDPGLIVYPAHRVLDLPDGFAGPKFLEALEPWFHVRPAQDGDLREAVNKEPGTAFGVAFQGGEEYIMTLKDIDRRDLLGDDHKAAWRDLDVAVLHKGILERVMGLPEGTEFSYIVHAEEALDEVRSGRRGMAVIMRNMNPAQICACADAREFMPQKATYFYPKLPSGAVLHRLE